MVIFFLFPNAFADPSGASLRPDVETLNRNNILLDFMKYFWANVDTPTNVCPSLHVIGTMACMFTVLHSERLKNKIFRAFIVLVSISICISTVFLRQHSILDVIVAVPICIIAEIICFAPHLLKCKKKAKTVTTDEPVQNVPVTVNQRLEQDTPVFLALTYNFIWIPGICLMVFLMPQHALPIILIGVLGIVAEIVFFAFQFSKYKKNAQSAINVVTSEPTQDNPVAEEVAVTDDEEASDVIETDVTPVTE